MATFDNYLYGLLIGPLLTSLTAVYFGYLRHVYFHEQEKVGLDDGAITERDGAIKEESFEDGNVTPRKNSDEDRNSMTSSGRLVNTCYQSTKQ